MSEYYKEGGTNRRCSSPSWFIIGQRGKEFTLPDLNSPASPEPTKNDISSPVDDSDDYWMAKTLLKLSSSSESVMMPTNSSHEVRKCEICNRIFHSYQAFGGHLASHVKRLKREAIICGDKQSDDLEGDDGKEDPGSSKEKVYECKICLQVFPTCQALGGHAKYHGKSYSGKFLAKKKKREERVSRNVEGMEKMDEDA